LAPDIYSFPKTLKKFVQNAREHTRPSAKLPRNIYIEVFIEQNLSMIISVP